MKAPKGVISLLPGIFLLLWLPAAPLSWAGNGPSEGAWNDPTPGRSEETVTFYSTSSDGSLTGKGDTYEWAHDKSWADYISSSHEEHLIGQYYNGDHRVYRAFEYFDTSSLSDDAEIHSATLSIYGLDSAHLGCTWNIVIQNGQPTYPHDPLIDDDFWEAHYSGNGGERDARLSTTSYNDIPLNGTGLSWINRTGTTKLCLRSSRDISESYPCSTHEQLTYWSADEAQVDERRPRITITYTANTPPNPPTLTAPPTGVYLAESAPTFAWIYSDDDGDPQQRFQIRINRNPDFSGTDHGSGAVTSAGSSWSPAGALLEGLWFWNCRTHDGTEWGSYSSTWTFTILAVVDIPLEAGWNLISFNLMPIDTGVAEVLASIAGLYEMVRSYEGGVLNYDPADPGGSDLTNMDPYHGYWIKMTVPATLSISGTRDVATTITLGGGWNLVSYLPDYELPVEEALQSLGGRVEVVQGFDGGGFTYVPGLPGYSDLDRLKPGFGYRVKVTGPATLDYDFVPPTITHTPITVWHPGTSIPITASVFDGSGVAEVRLYYRISGVGPFRTLSMSGAGGTYTATIPAGYVTLAGVDYYLDGVDDSLNGNTIYYGEGGETATEPTASPIFIDVRVLIPPPTSLFALPQGSGRIYLGWRLDSERPDVGYNVYRSATGGSGYARINPAPVTASTNYLDSSVSSGAAYYYTVRAEDALGFESDPSNEVRVTASSTGTVLYKTITDILPSSKYGIPKVGDINGDGLFDFLIVSREQISIDPDEFEDAHVKVYYHDATPAVDIDLGEPWHPLAASWTFWDMDDDGQDDGKEELIGVMKDPGDGYYYLHIKNGETGATRDRVQVANTVGADKYKAISIAYLDGVHPHIIYKCGTYVGQRRITVAYDRELNECWSYSESGSVGVSVCHRLETADIDEDGRDEVFNGAYVFDDDGSFLWPHPDDPGGHYWQQVDGVHVGDIQPSNPGQEVYMHVEQGSGGVHVTTKDGTILWERWDSPDCHNHAHDGWIADIRSDHPGMEIWVHHKNRDGMVDPYLYSSTGSVIAELELGPPIDWNGDAYKEVFKGGSICDGETFASIVNIGGGYKFVMDVVGDYREEIIRLTDDSDDNLCAWIYTNTDLISSRAPSPWDDRQYAQKQQWAGH